MRKWVLAAVALVSLNLFAAETRLELVAGEGRVGFSQAELLSRGDVQTVSTADSVYKQRFMQFKAIPIANLFKGLVVPEQAAIQFKGSDGFSAIVDKARLLNSDPKASLAFLAVEDPKNPWPALAGKTTSAGPFYLIWTNPQASGIGREEWPFQLASVEVLSDPHRAFPKIYPARDAGSNVQNGFRSFQKNCFGCHKLNGEGAGSVGPDLNLPKSPTEYLEAKALATLIRNPASLRSWPSMVMRGFSEAAIPDQEVSDLIAYLQYMAARR